MALYRLSVQAIHRANGQSAVASAAYRSGERLIDRRLEREFDFSRRSGVEHTEILLPEGAPERFADRDTLWNAVEAAERRKDARPAREVLLALPHELSFDQRRELVRAFAQEHLVGRGMIADIAMHTPDTAGDQRNFHAHIMITTREVGQAGFGMKGRAWDSPQAVRAFREDWERVLNHHLERALGEEFKPVTAKSLREQGLDREPEVHLGPRASDMERRGLRSERGDINREIRTSRDRLLEARRERNDLEDSLAAGDPKRELHVQTVARDLSEMRGQMVTEVKQWRKDLDALERPSVVTQAAIRRDLIAPLEQERKHARGQLKVERQRARDEGLNPRDIARWIKDPACAIFRAHARLNAIAKAQKEVRIAERAYALQDDWLRSDPGQAHLRRGVDPSRERAAESLTKSRTLERKIARGQARIRHVDATLDKLEKARKLGVEKILAPERARYGRDQLVRELDRTVVGAYNRQLGLSKTLSLDKGEQVLSRALKKSVGLPPL